MIIDQSSWHFKFLYWCNGNQTYRANNLCQYIKTLIQCMFLVFIVGFLIIFSVTVVGFILLYPIWQFIPFMSELNDDTIRFWSAVVWTILGWRMFVRYRNSDGISFDRKFKFSNKIKEEKPIKQKSPNIFIEYLKAKKSKICPMIEFKE